MRRKTCLFDALQIARKFVVDNLPYDEVTFITFHETEESYRFVYTATDFYNRNIDLSVYMNFLNMEISAEVVLSQKSLYDFWPKG